jgi:transporter family protein
MEGDAMWVLFALAAALAGAILVVLTKAGLKTADPYLALAIQSVLILVIAWGAVAVRGNLGEFRNIDGKAWAYLVAAGVVTGTSYLLLFQALKLGDASRVAPLDRLSLVFAIILGAVVLKEKIGTQTAAGGALMAVGAVLIAMAK